MLAKAYFDIALRRRGPEDMPAAGFFLGMSIMLFVVVDLLMQLLVTPAIAAGWNVIETVVETGFMHIFFGVLLTVSGRAARYNQTMSALLGSQSVIMLITGPLFAAFHGVEGPWQGTIFWLTVFWNILVIGHVLGRALEMHVVAGVVVATIYWVTLQVLIVGFMGAPT